MDQALRCCRLGGRVAYFQGDLPAAEKLYRKATLSRNESIPALEGLASVQMGTSDFHSGAETYADLVSQTQHVLEMNTPSCVATMPDLADA